MQKDQIQGYSFTIAAAVGFGLQPLLASFAFAYGVGSLFLAMSKVALMVPLFALIVRLRKERFRISLGDGVKIAFLALTGAVLTTGLLFTSYQYIDTGTATTLNFSYPAFVLGLGAIFYRERISSKTWMSFGICIVGVLLFCNPTGAFTWKGFWMALGSGISYGVYILYLDKSKILERVGFYPFTFWFFLFSSIFLFSLVWARGELRLSLPMSAWYWLILFALDGGIIATVLLQLGIQKIGSAKAAILGALEPVTSVVLGALFLDERLQWNSILATTLIILTTILLVGPEKEKSPAQSPEREEKSI